jgi:hypothetical protein
MSLDRLPLFCELDHSKRILIAGAGGGFDIYAGLPLYVYLKKQGKQVFLANLSFTNLTAVSGERVGELTMVGVDEESSGPKAYFPEGHLCQFLANEGYVGKVYCFEKTGVQPLVACYQHLLDTLQFDTVILVDGGTDILMRGDEAGLGTPVEDMTSLAAVQLLNVPRKIVVCVGFGVDRFHGVCHAQFLESVAAISKNDGYLGALSLLPTMAETLLFKDAVEYASSLMPSMPSIVCTSISSAIDGWYGDVHRTHRTRGSRLWINPLMSLLWAFRLPVVAERSLYLDRLMETQTVWDVQLQIEAFRKHQVDIKKWEEIPV